MAAARGKKKPAKARGAGKPSKIEKQKEAESLSTPGEHDKNKHGMKAVEPRPSLETNPTPTVPSKDWRASIAFGDFSPEAIATADRLNECDKKKHETKAVQPRPSLQTNPAPSKEWRASITFGQFTPEAIATADRLSKATISDAKNGETPSDCGHEEPITSSPLAGHGFRFPAPPRPEGVSYIRPLTRRRTRSAPDLSH